MQNPGQLSSKGKFVETFSDSKPAMIGPIRRASHPLFGAGRSHSAFGQRALEEAIVHAPFRGRLPKVTASDADEADR
jgi:hypothetical protein